LAEVAVRVDADADAARREERGCRQAELARTDVGHAVGQRWVIAIYKKINYQLHYRLLLDWNLVRF